MSYYDYKIVPAPKKAKKIKGVSGSGELFALTLNEAINEIARQGWEYYCSETLTAQTPGGWFKRAVTEEQVVLVFRKPREHLSPRLASAPEITAESVPESRIMEPLGAAARREPRIVEAPGPVPFQGQFTGPALGPAEKS